MVVDRKWEIFKDNVVFHAQPSEPREDILSRHKDSSIR